MMRLAAMDPLIALLIGIGWIVVKVLQTRKKDAESWGDLNEQPPASKPHVPSRGQGAPPAKLQMPRRNALPPMQRQRPGIPQPRQPNPSSPRPIIQTVSPARKPQATQGQIAKNIELAALKESQELYARTQSLDKAVANRLASIEKETTSARPAPVQPRTRPLASAHILRTMRHRTTARQALLASLVLNPPKALE
jgi:hypothetical protein